MYCTEATTCDSLLFFDYRQKSNVVNLEAASPPPEVPDFEGKYTFFLK